MDNKLELAPATYAKCKVFSLDEESRTCVVITPTGKAVTVTYGLKKPGCVFVGNTITCGTTIAGVFE